MFIKEYWNMAFTASKFDDAAFPQIIDHEEGTILIKGLTKREYFAALAMQGFCSIQDKGKFSSLDDAYNHAARHSVSIADALIKALNESKP